MGMTLGERVAALEAQAMAHGIEARDMKAFMTSMDSKLDVLIEHHNQQMGAINLGKVIASTGIFGAIGALALAFWDKVVG